MSFDEATRLIECAAPEWRALILVAVRTGLPGWPAMAESVIVARDAIMAAELGARLHVCHVSTAATVEVVRWAKQQGFPVTAEATQRWRDSRSISDCGSSQRPS